MSAPIDIRGILERAGADAYAPEGSQALALAQVGEVVAELVAFREAAVKALIAVCGLIDDSEGVQGLHLNGDLATWAELRSGGRFEAWLSDFDAAVALMDGAP